ncbi:hypothetical protein CKAH01_01391 [Colletotrichum kahawae]|uniref:Uncharacterized protein n=1 Tax=Colletotrichum kahawae TaxID=34407 RepID=A0AAD9Y8Y8_COLKA|nr:hypothetical protein CKAH01_01391 [Colletotrichum kahawae]
MAWLVSVLAFYDAALEKLHQHSEHNSRRQQSQDKQTSQQGGAGFVFTFVFNGDESLSRGVQERVLIGQPFITLESIYGKLRQDFSRKLLAALLCLGVGSYAIMTPRFFSSLTILFNILEHQQIRITGSGRSTIGRATVELPHYFLLFAIPLAQAVYFFFAFMALDDREAGEFKIQGGSARKEGADEKERLAIAGDGVYSNCCLEPLRGKRKGGKKNKNWSEK